MLTVVVVSLDPGLGDDPDLRSELSLARSAALYADRIVLFSPSEQAASLRYGALQGRIDPAVLLERLRRERPKLAERFGGERGLLEGMVARSAAAHMPAVFRAVEEFVSARRVGFVEPISSSASDDQGHADAEAFERELLALLADPAVHAVCDKRGAALVRRLTAGASPASLRRHRRAELGAGFIARLPAFPQTPLDELLDLKAGLAGPLGRYRTAVGRLEAGLDAADGPWEAEDAIEALWRSEVEPSLQELEDSLVEHSLVRELARAASASARDLVLSGSALAVAVATVGQVAASLASAAGVVAAAGQVGATAAFERGERRRAAERSDFYYLQQLHAAMSPS